MMMLRGTVGALVSHVFPADRCSWLQIDDATGGYSVTDVRFYPGANTSISGSTGTTVHAMTDATIGFIGKSGRFTPISN